MNENIVAHDSTIKPVDREARARHFAARIREEHRRYLLDDDDPQRLSRAAWKRHILELFDVADALGVTERVLDLLEPAEQARAQAAQDGAR